MTPTKKECCVRCQDAYFPHDCSCHQETTGWEDWVRTLANSTNPRDVDLLIAKIKVEITAVYNQGKEDAVAYIKKTEDISPDFDPHGICVVKHSTLESARSLTNTTN